MRSLNRDGAPRTEARDVPNPGLPSDTTRCSHPRREHRPRRRDLPTHVDEHAWIGWNVLRRSRLPSPFWGLNQVVDVISPKTARLHRRSEWNREGRAAAAGRSSSQRVLETP